MIRRTPIRQSPHGTHYIIHYAGVEPNPRTGPRTAMTSPPADTSRLPLAAGFPAADDATWRALVDKALKGADFRKRLVARTADGLDIEPLYTRPATEHAERPGAAPFTRGSASRLAAGGWRIAQIRTEASPQALCAAIIADIDGGAEAVTIQLAAPGQPGLPASADALEAALTAVPLDRVRISLSPGAHGLTASRALTAIAAKRGAAFSIGSLGIDPLGVLAATGDATILKPGMAAFAEALPWLPAPATTLVADARPYHDAGASEAQEIAALASTLVAYLRAGEATGLAPARALPCIGLAMAVDADLFMSLAKLRAARRIVHRIAGACGAGEAAGTMQLAATTSQRMMGAPRSLGEHAARDRGGNRGCDRGSRRNHGAALHLGDRPAGRLGKPHRSAMSAWCCARKPASAASQIPAAARGRSNA